MANIKTLYGSDKLREAYPKINENFNALNSDIDGIKSRVNKIITTPIDGEAAAQEIVDARGEYSTLGERLDEIEQSGGGGSAAEITYDNAESELEADNVQNAIDETVEIINAHKAESATKHITESGTNENGSYIRFDDGTQICYHSMTATGATADRMSATWTLPSAMIDSNYSVSSAFRNTGFPSDLPTMVGGVRAKTKGSVRIDLINTVHDVSAESRTVYSMAIGRWK